VVGREDPTLDVTEKLAGFGERTARRLSELGGYIFKKGSPSCGLERVPVYDGNQKRAGRGVYAEAFLREQPWLPAEEEGRLGDPGLRDNFLERVFAYQRWCLMTDAGLGAARLGDFHAAHKLALMAHDPRATTELGRIVARAGRGQARAVAREYLIGFMATLARPATPARHENALSHLMGYLRRVLASDDKVELLENIRRYRAGELPRAAVLVLLRHHFRRHPDPYVTRQVYLYPDAREQLLRGL
jgi:uncharacterized protein YbgA (DUF1722 family)